MKLDNTLFDGQKPPFIKICDFGFARAWQDSSLYRMSSRVGYSLNTPHFLPFIMPSHQHLLCTTWMLPHDVMSLVHCCTLWRKLGHLLAVVEVRLLSHSWALLLQDMINASDSNQSAMHHHDDIRLIHTSMTSHSAEQHHNTTTHTAQDSHPTLASSFSVRLLAQHLSF